MSDPLPAAAAPNPVRALPPRPNLEHLRGQAKTLLNALQRDEANALARFKQVVPHRSAPWQLADAQLAVAREYGQASWPKLVRAVEAILDASSLKARQAAFLTAIRSGEVETVRGFLIQEPDARTFVNAPVGSFGSRPIFSAKSNAAMLDLLLLFGADINLKSDWWAGPWGILDDVTAAEAELLLTRGATIDLFAAAHLDRIDLLTAMLDSDPKLVDAKGGDGGRPLHFATSIAAMELLLSRGADIDARDVDHLSTPLQWQMPRPNDADRGERLTRMRWLVDHGAAIDIFAAVALGDESLVNRALAEYPQAIGIRINAPDYPPCPLREGGHIYAHKLGNALTAVEVATHFGNEAALARLLGASSPVHRMLIAIAGGRVADARALIDADPSLLARMTPEDHRALPTAAWRRDMPATLFMLDVGFDPFAPGPDGGTVLHCAAWQGMHELVEQILAHPRVRPVLATLIATKDTAHGSTPLGWCCHGSSNCHNPGGDYPRIARALVGAGSVIGPNLGDATAEVRKALGV